MWQANKITVCRLLLTHWLWTILSVSPDFQLPFLIQNRKKSVNVFYKYD